MDDVSVARLFEQASQEASRLSNVLHGYADFGVTNDQAADQLANEYIVYRKQLNATLSKLVRAHPKFGQKVTTRTPTPSPVPIPAPVVVVPETKPVPVPVPTNEGDLTQGLLSLTAANWIGEWSGRVPTEYVRTLVSAAGDRTLLLIPYFMYGRDNGNYSAGGAHSEQEFRGFYQGTADAVGNESAWAVVEPDSLGLLDGLSAEGKQQRLRLLQEAIDILNTKPNIVIWLDISTWLSPEEAANRLRGFNGIDGFSLNVSGYLPNGEILPWAERVSELTGLRHIIDTSRNGRGNPHPPAWCNVTDTIIGLPPTTKTHSRNCAAYFWGKLPGESDGLKINGHDNDGQSNRTDIPRAGENWPEFRQSIFSGDWTEFKRKYNVR